MREARRNLSSVVRDVADNESYFFLHQRLKKVPDELARLLDFVDIKDRLRNREVPCLNSDGVLVRRKIMDLGTTLHLTNTTGRELVCPDAPASFKH